jgi:amidohydrolase
VNLDQRVKVALQKEIPRAVELRHRLHAAPYVSGAEHPTATAVVEALGWGAGIPVADAGRLVGAVPGAVVLRAELDGLPILEQNEVSWASTRPAMHACGHDVHMAATVAAAHAIASCRPEVPVGVLFQPREEMGASGAFDVVRSNVLTDCGVRALVAAHVQPQLPPGVIGVRPGLVNASVDEFEIIVRGHGGHAAYPHIVRDPVLAICAVVLALQQLVSRRVDPVRGAVCTIGSVTAGSAPNVVPDEASLLGTLRLMDPDARPALREDLANIARSTAEAYGCTAELIARSEEPALTNDSQLAAATAARLRAAGVPVDTHWRSFGSDDFSYYGAEVPSLMAFVGVDGGAGLHEARFLPPDDTVELVARVLVEAYLAAAAAPIAPAPATGSATK